MLVVGCEPKATDFSVQYAATLAKIEIIKKYIVAGPDINQKNDLPVIGEMFPDEGDVIDASVDGYITFYDPDGEVESLSFNGDLVEKEYWVKLDNGYWKLNIEWDGEGEEPDTYYSFEVVVVDNDGFETKKRINFKTK